MKLQIGPFELIQHGSKTVELRLFDEKRQVIKVGDEIEFSQIDDPKQKLLVHVTELLQYDSFKDLFDNVPPEETGSDSREDWKFMRRYYSEEDEKKFGVVGIRFTLQ